MTSIDLVVIDCNPSRLLAPIVIVGPGYYCIVPLTFPIAVGTLFIIIVIVIVHLLCGLLLLFPVCAQFGSVTGSVEQWTQPSSIVYYIGQPYCYSGIVIIVIIIVLWIVVPCYCVAHCVPTFPQGRKEEQADLPPTPLTLCNPDNSYYSIIYYCVLLCLLLVCVSQCVSQ